VSGIAGVRNLDGAPVEAGLLREMAALQGFRGPDRQDVWLAGPVGLCHTLLKTTAESEHERQPLTEDGETWITADARVDGRQTLMEKLRSRGLEIPRWATDASLILQSYRAWSEGCLEHLLGDFCFAIWDAPRQRLFCAVDHLGVKPFYYSWAGNAFVFSNTLDCVRLHPLVSDRLDDVAIGDFLLFGHYQDQGITAYSDIRRVPPGHSLVVSRGPERPRRFWALPAQREPPPHRASDVRAFFDKTLDEAVGDRLRCGRIGVLMSGGVDSPLVTAAAASLLAAEGGTTDLRASTAVLDSLIADSERTYAQLSADALKVPIVFYPADDVDLYGWVDQLDWTPPEPLHDPLWGLQISLLRDAERERRVLLTGWDGDALLEASVPRHWASRMRAGRWRQLLGELAWYIRSQHRLPPVGARTALKRAVRQVQERPPLPPWIECDFARRTALADRWMDYSRPRASAGVRGAAHESLTSPLWARLFDGYDAGWTGRAVDVRHPLMDLRLVGFLSTLPAVPWCVDKEIFRARLRRYLPPAVTRRPKSPLSEDPVVAKMRREGLGPRAWVGGPDIADELSRYISVSRIPERDVPLETLQSSLRAASLGFWIRSRRHGGTNGAEGIGRRRARAAAPEGPVCEAGAGGLRRPAQADGRCHDRG
jgi:asparagine synthase (glutamine-hydrolysing)